MGMDFQESSRQITERDLAEHERPSLRLAELNDVMPNSEFIGFAGTATELMFEDVKATWIYGYFTSTIITSYAFCLQQLANKMRLVGDAQGDVGETLSLDAIVNIAATQGLIGVDLQAELLQLHDRAMPYILANTIEHLLLLDRHFNDATHVSDEDPASSIGGCS